MSIRFIRGASILALLVMLTTGCGSGGSTDASSAPTVEPSAGAPAVEGAGTESPAVESTGTEPPASGGGGKPAVQIAGGPAGDGGQNDNGDGTVCVTVQWLGGQDDANLGGGIAFKVTKVRLAHAERADFSCDGDPCAGFTFQSNSDSCTQAVRPGNTEGTLSLYGRVLCSASRQDCQDFRSRLKLRTISISPVETGGDGNGGSTSSDGPAEPQPGPPSPVDQPSPAE